MPTLQFLGATDTVTGSKTAIEHDGRRILVDCGLFQGIKQLRMRNWERFAIEPSSIDAVVLTHAHIDHSGYLPRLCRDGFTGPIFCSPGTRDLLRVLLPDSGYLQEEQARFLTRRGTSRHDPVLPLYTEQEANAALTQVRAMEFAAPFDVAPGMRATLRRAGHIIGASTVRVEVAGRSVTFSGDVGRRDDPLMRPPEPIAATDVLVVESTYGDRRHRPAEALEQLATILDETFARGGVVVVPAFAVGRAQHLLHAVAQLAKTGRMPNVPVFLDSPMAIAATGIFVDNAGDHRLSEAQSDAMCAVARYSNTPDDSKAIDARSGPMLVISASGMATGGRVLHHLVRFMPDPKNTILLVGFQSAGTRGRALSDGAEELKIFGDYVPVRARIAKIDGLSAHGDWAEIIAWLGDSGVQPQRVFVNHGEPAAADAMRRRLADHFGWDVTLPHHGEQFAF